MLNKNLKKQSNFFNKIVSFYRRKKLNRWVIFILALILVLLILIPVFWMIRISISPKTDVFLIPIKWIPTSINFEGYKTAFSTFNIGQYYINSIIVSLSTVIICISAGTLAAFSFSRMKFKGKAVLMTITLTAQMFPWALLILSLYIFFLRAHLFNTLFGLILAHSTFALPLAVWIIKSYFDTVPKELEEAAYIDGCSRFKVLYSIMLPICYPGVVAAGIYAFIFSWNDFLFGMTLANKASARILSPGMVLSFVGQYNIFWVEMMASSILISLPVAVLFLFLQRFFVAGLTAGAVKE